jgi:hypothetical protein
MECIGIGGSVVFNGLRWTTRYSAAMISGHYQSIFRKIVGAIVDSEGFACCCSALHSDSLRLRASA